MNLSILFLESHFIYSQRSDAPSAILPFFGCSTHQQFCTLLAKALDGDFTWYESFLRAVGLRFCLFLCFLYEELSPGNVKSGTRDILDRTRNQALYDAVTALEAMYGFGVVSAYVEKLRLEKFSHPQMG